MCVAAVRQGRGDVGGRADGPVPGPPPLPAARARQDGGGRRHADLPRGRTYYTLINDFVFYIILLYYTNF